MKFIRLYLVLMLLAGTSASAGCANFEDGSLGRTAAPKYRICYDGVCDETQLSYECANIFGMQQGFANGWAIDIKLNEGAPQRQVITWQGRVIDANKHDRLTFEKISD